jgi:hypothetical protein
LSSRHRPWTALATVFLAGTLAMGVVPAGAVVQARSPRDAQPRVTARVPGEPARSPGTVGLMPLGDAPRAPGTGQAVGDALCAALASRGSGCHALAPPRDSAGSPLSGGMVSDTHLVRSGREAGVEVAIAGRVILLDIDANWLPDLEVWRFGVGMDVPAGGVIRTNLAFRLRAVATESGTLLCSAQVTHGPVERLPEQALAEAMSTVLDECFGAGR